MIAIRPLSKEGQSPMSDNKLSYEGGGQHLSYTPSMRPPSNQSQNSAMAAPALSAHASRAQLRLAQHDAYLLRALADPTRLTILTLLKSLPETLTVSELVMRIKNISQPTVSHHLRILREAGLIEPGKKGAFSYYSVCDERLREAAQIINQLFLL